MTFSPNPEPMTTEQEERIVCLRGRFARDGARLKGDAFAEDVFLALEALDATRASLKALEAQVASAHSLAATSAGMPECRAHFGDYPTQVRCVLDWLRSAREDAADSRASLAAAEAKLEPTKWGHVRAAIEEMRSDERGIEDAAAKRIAEWMRGEYPKGMRAFVSSVAHNAADAIERGDWRPK